AWLRGQVQGGAGRVRAVARREGGERALVLRRLAPLRVVGKAGVDVDCVALGGEVLGHARAVHADAGQLGRVIDADNGYPARRTRRRRAVHGWQAQRVFLSGPNVPGLCYWKRERAALTS